MRRHYFNRQVARVCRELPPEWQVILSAIELHVADAAPSSRPELVASSAAGSLSAQLPENETYTEAACIVLYRHGISHASRGRRALRSAIRRVLIHQLANQAGISEQRLRELGFAG